MVSGFDLVGWQAMMMVVRVSVVCYGLVNPVMIDVGRLV